MAYDRNIKIMINYLKFYLLFQVVLFAIVAAVYAEAEAEADPGLLYAAAAPYGYATPYAYGAYGLAATPFKSAPCVNAANIPVPCAAASYGYAAYASPYALYGRKKREAEADASADALLYASPYGYAAAPYAYAAAPYAYAGLPLAYTHPSNYGLCTNYLGVQVPC